MGWLLTVFVLLQVLHHSVCKNSYIATVPKTIRPGGNAEITIAAVNNPSWTSDADVTLYNSKNQSISNVKSNGIQGGVAPVTVVLPIPKDIKSDDNYKIRVQSTNGLTFDETTDRIYVASKSASIFIQTDKPQYKPGDLVQFRVFGADPKLKISNDPMTIYIEDPKQNRLQQHLSVNPESGVFTGSFQLSTLTSMGTWNLIVEQGREKTTKGFVVEEVVLPKFEVTVVLPSFQLKTDSHFTATIRAQYTFGKPVEGSVKMYIYNWDKNRGIVKQFKIKGRAKIRVKMSEIAPRFYGNVQVSAEVTEAVTGKMEEGKGRTSIYDTPEKLTFSPTMSNNFKPGLDYNIVLRATQQDDKPLKGHLGMVNITVKYNVLKPVERKGNDANVIGCRGSNCPPPPPLEETEEKVLWSKLVQIPTSGLMEEIATFPMDAMSGRVEADYRASSERKYLSKAESPSNNYIQVVIVNDQKAKAGTNLPLIINATEPVSHVHYKIFSKQYMMQQGTFDMKNRKSRRVRVPLTTEMAPYVKLLVYYTRPSDGEIVAAALRFPVDDMFENKVSLSFNKKRVLPGTTVNLNVRADPASLVNILAVDKSVLLLRTGNDVTVNDVMEEILSYDRVYEPRGSWDFWFPRPVPSIDASSVFNEVGVHVLTDSLLYKHSVATRRSNMRLGGGGGGFSFMASAPMADMDGGLGSAEAGSLAEPTRVRKNFAETWLWTNTTIGRSGRAKISAVAPDTITEWVTSAFAVNPTSGLGVASDLANLTTFQRFFMRFELPYSAVRGEILIVRISLFNYLKRNISVQVQFANSDGFSFVDANGEVMNTGNKGRTKTTSVAADSVSSVYFPIKLSKVGKIALSATARSKDVADAVERQLLVEAEGMKQSYNIPLLFTLKSSNQPVTSSTPVTYPADRVSDSTFIKVKVIGDILGPALANVENLLGSTSYGSGEQNMITFVPNVYISSYLKTTNRMTSDIKDKTEELMQGGYQRQLSFARGDGSFSAFGFNDPSGSTWLTAYVVKSFAQAAEFTFIDTQVITKAIQWLLQQQTPNGDFSESGIFIKKEMQGGSTSSARSLTAFVLVALYEARANDQVTAEIKDRVNTAITSATNFVANGAPASIANVYELAISFYALSLVNHASKDLLLVELERKESIKDEEKFWQIPKTEADIIQPWQDWSPPDQKVRALDIETTSYVLLGYNLKDDTRNGTRILRWLGRQRRSNGGFQSTQDTAVALEGLSELAKKLYVPTTSLTVAAKGDNWAGKTFNIQNENALVLQIEDVPQLINKFDVTVSGNGVCLMEIDVTFNVMRGLREPAFNLTHSLPKDTTDGFRLRTCFRYLKGRKSGMALLEISLPSGMDADLASLSTPSGRFKKVEKAFRQVNLYFDSILNTEECVELDVNRVNLVARHQDVPIRLSEIQEPSNEGVIFYKSEALSSATIIEVCGADETCLELRR